MATALRFADLRSIDPEAIKNALFEMGATATLPIPTVETAQIPVPDRIIVREVDFVGGLQGPLGYARPDQTHECHNLADVRAMINHVRLGYNPQVPALPFERPMDLSLRAPTCFIFRLSDNWNWRFSRKAPGASFGATVGADIVNYCNLRHVLPDGTEQSGHFTETDAYIDRNCRLIYFYAKPIAGVPDDPTKEFNHPFNLNVELFYPNDQDGKPNTIQLVIDPDVRYPGGSGYEGYP